MTSKLAVFLLLTLTSFKALACMCVDMSLVEKYEKSDAVLYGFFSKPPSVETLIAFNESQKKETPKAEFSKIEILKGAADSGIVKIAYMSGTTCEAPISLHAEVILFASRNEKGELQISRCSMILAEQLVSEDGRIVGPSPSELSAMLGTLRKQGNK